MNYPCVSVCLSIFLSVFLFVTKISVALQSGRQVQTGVICVDTVNQLLFVFRKISQCLHLSCLEPASYCLQYGICLIILTDCHTINSPELVFHWLIMK